MKCWGKCINVGVWGKTSPSHMGGATVELGLLISMLKKKNVNCQNLNKKIDLCSRWDDKDFL